MENKAFFVIEPFNIKVRRFIAKLLNREDKVVTEFDKKAMDSVKDTNGHL